MSRRRFLASACALAGLPWLPACAPPAPALAVLRPGMPEGHALRDRRTLPPPSGELRCAVAILGSGVAGLTAAWTLARAGQRDLVLVDGPEPDGNAAGGQLGGIACPRGAHYLPLPDEGLIHVREMLADLGVLTGGLRDADPEYDEHALVHPAAERTLADGVWQEGLLPAGTSAQAAASARFTADMQAWTTRRGRDGRHAFTLPLADSSADPELRALDRLTFADWLDRAQHVDPALRHYIDYAMRDDYGAPTAAVSAWAGLHYFCCRRGRGRNAEPGTVLTWPQGLSALTAGLRRRLGGTRTLAGHAVELREHRSGVGVTVLDAAGRTLRVRADRAVCAMPLHAARLIDPALNDALPRDALPESAPWLVANLLLDGFPHEKPGADLAWDNVVHAGKGLGYVVATHQLTRVARPAATVFTAYRSGWDSPQECRAWLAQASDLDLAEFALQDVDAAYDRRWRRRLRAVELVVRGHAMAIPRPGFLEAPARTLSGRAGRIRHAHADLGGLSVFEEASWWGMRAAQDILGAV